ncbi:hypothetical protein [Bacteriovorax sp. Seq25_V]|uniref:hypothetical protein n=1 Tax=Bacteriovorax sp. Seq25_V TaxID=1201288 RepID=UPI000389E67C|nr:hypothetical protein [Bacteriovorax sp. Seq25_V]EQC47287.1 hypothetical protein M900_0975 [Bacteriovorax sp. Seq25_V]
MRLSSIIPIFFLVVLLQSLPSCKSDVVIDIEESSSYTVNFDGTQAYGVLDTLWRPVGANWEIEIVLIWDSSKAANTYPIATGSSATSIYIDSSGLPLFKYENQYITANVTRLTHGVEAVIKFSVSATEVKHYMNNVLEGTIATTKTLLNDWEVVGAHSSLSLNYKGKIRKIVLRDLDSPSNTRTIDLIFSGKELNNLSSSFVRAKTAVNFNLNTNSKFITY